MILRFCKKALEKEFRMLRQASQAMARTATLDDMARIVAEQCKIVLRADAICVHVLEEDDIFVLKGSIGCTDEFLKKWKRVPRTVIPELKDGRAADLYFLGSAADFKRNIPIASDVVDQSGRKTIAYTPFIIDDRVRGMLGFSYNQVCTDPPSKELVLTLASICASALEHSRLCEQERWAHRQAEDASRAKSEFVAGISHEIRSPLGVIQGFADLIFETSQLDPETRQWVAGIRRNARQLGRLIGDVLDMAKIEAKKIEVENIEFSPREFFQEIKDTFELQAAEKSVKLDFKTALLPERLTSDPTRLRQIMLNLIGNALKFTFHGSIEVTAEVRDAFLEIRVCDTGVGIPADRQAQVFEPYTQAEASTGRRFGGTGLGLPISKILAEALGGTLVLEKSGPGLGSTFLCTVKCRSAGETAVPIPPTPGLDDDLRGIRILLVEDNEDNQDLLRQILWRAGAEVDVAGNGASGVQMALRKRYDVVLMDIQMPGIDGFKAVSLLRQKGYVQPVAALTANALKSEMDSFRDRGFDEYLTKPIERPKLIQAIRRLSMH